MTFDEAGYGSRSFSAQMSKVITVMKTNSLTAPTPSRSKNTIFSWANIAHLLNALPMGICECKTAEDAKGYVKTLSLIVSALILASIEKGGSL